MVESAIDYQYSSARHHVGQVDNELIADYDIGVSQDKYQAYLQSMLKQQHSKRLKTNTHKGLPCGDDDFIAMLSKKVGRDLRFKSVGRPKKG